LTDASEPTMAFARLEVEFEGRSPQAICGVMDGLLVLRALRTQRVLDGAGEIGESFSCSGLRLVAQRSASDRAQAAACESRVQ
jgi:hypothetical protein